MRAVGVVLVVVLCAALAPAPASAIRLEDVQLPEFHLDGKAFRPSHHPS